MAQTKRLLSAIWTLLADNASGAISETDLRDAVTTVQPGHGEISVTSSAETTVPDTSAWTQGAGTYALSSDAMDWDMNTSGQLRYTGTPNRVAHIALSFSMTSAGTNKTYSIGVGKNGSIITPSIIQRKIATGSDVGAAATHAFIAISTNDYLTCVVRGDTDATNMTFNNVNLFAMDMAT